MNKNQEQPESNNKGEPLRHEDRSECEDAMCRECAALKLGVDPNSLPPGIGFRVEDSESPDPKKSK